MDTQAKEDAWIETYNGHRYNFYNIENNVYDLDDIATALSRLCRYNGHTKRFYSVAEHDCVMFDWVWKQSWSTPQDALTALHHDDAEYVIGDLPRPFKLELPDFKNKELEIDQAIAKKFNTHFPFPSWLKWLDTAMLQVEREQVMNSSENQWQIDVEVNTKEFKLWNIMGRFSWYVKWQWLRRHRKAMRMIEKENDKKLY